MYKMKKLISVLMCGIILLCTFSLSACNKNTNTSQQTSTMMSTTIEPTFAANTSEKDYEYNITNGEITIRRYKGSEPNVIMPSGIIGYPVTSIADYAFKYCNEILESITIPSSVKSIGNSAFQGNINLTTLTIQNGVESIGESAFSGCEKLKNFSIPSSVSFIGGFAFYCCSSLTSITIPGNVKSIGEGAFYAERYRDSNDFISNLTNLTIQNGVESIGRAAFYGCNKLESVTIPGSVKNVGADAFSLDLDTAFHGNYVTPPLTSKLVNLTIENGVEVIGEGAFEACFNLKSIHIPGSVKIIDAYTFHGCKGLSNLTIDEGVESIYSDAFRLCINLTSVTIPSSVTFFQSEAFNECPNIEINR